MRTQVAIVGGGPAGLMLAHLASRAGIESVVLESRPRAYAERRVRASVLEPSTVELLKASGVGERLQQEGRDHDRVELRFDGQRHRIPLGELVQGQCITVYDQQDVVQDLIAARLQAGGRIEFAAEVVAVDGPASEQPVVHYRQSGQSYELACDVVVGCDGFWGVSRSAIPTQASKIFRREYPFAWLGVLAAVPPPDDAELVYAHHAQGFALWGLHAADMVRLYLQCQPGESVDDWPAERIWREARSRLETRDGFTLTEGTIVEKGVTTLHSFVIEPMQYGRVFLAGDAAHLMPPTAASGLNLAMAEVQILAQALAAWFRSGDTNLLEAYSSTCLRRVWWAEHFSWWMTWLLHRVDDDFQQRLQLVQLQQIVASRAAATAFAENYLGLMLP